jgi:hypothetical protein
MKFLVAVLLVLGLVSATSAMNIDDIVKLSKLKTADSIIISLLQKEPLKSSVTAKDVLYLKENQVSDAVIDYLLRTSGDEKSPLLYKQEGESTQLSENLRTYYTTSKNGKRVRVVTNLDENGKRMGKPVPPETKTEEKEYERPEEPPREIIVTVRQEAPPVPPELEEYPEPEPVTNGIPLDYAYGSSYYPSYYPYSPFFQNPVISPNYPSRPFVPTHFRPQFQRRPFVRSVPRVARPARGNSAGTMRLR